MPTRVLSLLAVGAVVLSGCATRKQYGVPTSVDPVKGNCNTSRTIEAGATLDLSGPDKALGNEYLVGLRLALSHVNNNHGVLKNQSCLELLYKDDKGDPRTADKAVLDLANNEVVKLLVGPQSSNSVRGSGSNLGLVGVPTSDMSTLDDIRTGKGDWPMMFPTAPSQSTIASAEVKYAQAHGWTSLVVAAVDDPAGQQGLADLRTAAKSAGITISGTATVKPGTNPDLASLRTGPASAIVVEGDTSQVAGILKARGTLGANVPVIGGPILSDASVVSQLAATDMAGVTVVAPKAAVLPVGTGQSSDPNMAGFVANLSKELHGPPTGSVISYAEAYDALTMLAYAATSANTSNTVNAANVETFLENANYQGLLASYSYVQTRHTGVAASQVTTAALDSLAGGFFHQGTAEQAPPQ